MPLVRRVSRLCRLMLPVLLIAVGVTASAQINEQDRLNRCANNRAALLRLQEELQGMPNDEQMARLRAADRAMRERAENMFYDGDELQQIARNPITATYTANQKARETANVEARRATEAEEFDSIGATLRLPGCGPRSDACLKRVVFDADELVRRAELLRSESAARRQEMARYQTNYMALRCDLPAQVATLPDLAGTWYREGRTSLPTSIAQNGRTLVFSNEMRPPMTSQGHFVGADEVVADQWEGGLVGIVSADRRHIAWRNGTNWSR